MRSQNYEIALAAVSFEKFFKQINAAAIEHSVRFVEQQQTRFELIAFGDRESALHSARQGRCQLVGAGAKFHR